MSQQKACRKSVEVSNDGNDDVNVGDDDDNETETRFLVQRG